MDLSIQIREYIIQRGLHFFLCVLSLILFYYTGRRHSLTVSLRPRIETIGLYFIVYLWNFNVVVFFFRSAGVDLISSEKILRNYNFL